MTKRTIAARTKIFAIGVAIVAMSIGAEYVRAAADHPENAGAVETIPAADRLAAELDPVFVQKLAEHWRRPYRHAPNAMAQR